MKYNINMESLRDTYIIANTALFIISNFKSDETIQHLQENVDIEDLINEFKSFANSEIGTIEELVYCYALYIAILLKREIRSDQFLLKEGNVNYEWFPEIKSVYYEKLKPTSVSIFNDFNGSSLKIQSYKIAQDNAEDTYQEIDCI